jgi:hypothetical protein
LKGTQMTNTSTAPNSPLITVRETVIDGAPAFVASGPNATDMLARGSAEAARENGLAYYLRTRPFPVAFGSPEALAQAAQTLTRCACGCLLDDSWRGTTHCAEAEKLRLAATPATWAVKCDDCKTTMRRTEDVRESYAGGICDGCRDRYLVLRAEASALAPPQTTSLLRAQARVAEERLDWLAAADLWAQAQAAYPLMPGRKEHGSLAKADLANMAAREASCRATERERVADRLAEMDAYTR